MTWIQLAEDSKQWTGSVDTIAYKTKNLWTSWQSNHLECCVLNSGFITELCVYCAVRAEAVHKIQVSFNLAEFVQVEGSVTGQGGGGGEGVSLLLRPNCLVLYFVCLCNIITVGAG